MSGLTPMDLAGTIVGFILTLLIFSYLIGDNPLFRIAVYLFVGITAGLAAVVAWTNVLRPQLLDPLISGSQPERLLALFPLALSVLLLLKISRRTATWGSAASAYLVGIGAATAVGGAILGTLFTQVGALINLFDRQALTGGLGVLLESLVIFAGALAAFLSFNFTVREKAQPAGGPAWMQGVAVTGKVFIVIALGSLFAGVFTASLAAFVERWQFLGRFVLDLLAMQ